MAQLEREDFAVLDPACGDGELLLAVAAEAAELGLPAPRLVGVDRDAGAVAVAAERLAAARMSGTVLRVGDFLADGPEPAHDLPAAYDLVISNPPYVRTQVLGAARAQALGRQFGLGGRVDLYHAFVAAMTSRLAERGVLGLVCSNRFLTTRGGRSLRSLLLGHYEIRELWDLGDTKLFDAAVLPAVVVARSVATRSSTFGSFVRVYEGAASSGRTAAAEESLLAALQRGAQGLVEVDGRRFDVERGRLQDAEADRPWRLTTASGARWLEAVERRSAGRFGDLGRIRVGIKTTADSVFVRAAWDDLPEDVRPEDELVRRLLTHRVAARWRVDESGGGARSVLYPHVMEHGCRRPVDLDAFPRTAAYLELHRERLEGREYVRRAGRAWFEIWVPQQPDAWAAPKLVWPDISNRPRFFLDDSGSIVNGDCYWFSCDGMSRDEVAVAVAVANSSFALEYYDRCCGNRLYGGRRRFITQYLEALPIPETTRAARRHVVELVEPLLRGDLDADARAATESVLDAAVFELFGAQAPRAIST